MKKILVLGGYGMTGECLVHWLLRETDSHVVIAGRNLESAKNLVAILDRNFKGRVEARHADASNASSLKKAFQGMGMVLSAGTTTDFVGNVARAALDADIDYFDIHYPKKVIETLASFREEIEKREKVFITQGGCHPGLPAILVRAAASNLDVPQKASVGIAIYFRYPKGESMLELVDELVDYRPECYDNGSWHPAGFSRPRKIDFEGKMGTRSCYPFDLPEMKALPETLGLTSLDMHIAGGNWMTDRVLMPAFIVMSKLGFRRKFLGNFYVSGMNAFLHEKPLCSFLAEVSGEKESRPCMAKVVVEHEDVLLFTVAPVVSLVRQYLAKEVPPGLHLMGHVANAANLLSDIEKMGIRVSVKVRS